MKPIKTTKIVHKQKKNILHLPILIEQDEDGIYIVSCPNFKGCHSFGKSIDDALTNIKEVIDLCLEEQKEKPKPFNRFIGFREMSFTIASR